VETGFSEVRDRERKTAPEVMPGHVKEDSTMTTKRTTAPARAFAVKSCLAGKPRPNRWTFRVSLAAFSRAESLLSSAR